MGVLQSIYEASPVLQVLGLSLSLGVPKEDRSELTPGQPSFFVFGVWNGVEAEPKDWESYTWVTVTHTNTHVV